MIPHQLDRILAIDELSFREIESRARALDGQFDAQAVRALHDQAGEDALYRRIDRVALIEIDGPISKRRGLGSFFFGGASATDLADAIGTATRDASIDSILLRIFSPGGSVFGISQVADLVFQAREKKRVVAFVDDMAASAAYWIAAQADEIVSTPSAMIGSIGVYMVVDDWSGYFEKAGVKTHVIRTGEFKGAGTTGEKITEGQLQAWQAEIDTIHELFLAAVARGRGMDVEAVRKLADGSVRIGTDAVNAGLADQVGTFEATLETLRTSSGTSSAGRTT